MKSRLLIIYSIIYGLAMFAFTFYWSTNFSRHTTYKGDEFFYLAEYLLLFNFLYLLIIQLTVKKINFLLILLIPIVTAIGAFIIGLIFLLATQISGIPKHYITTYGILNGLLTLFSVFKFWRQPTISIYLSSCNKCSLKEIASFSAQNDFEAFDLDLTKRIVNEKTLTMKEFVHTAYKDIGYQVYECNTCGQKWKLNTSDNSDRRRFTKLRK